MVINTQIWTYNNTTSFRDLAHDCVHGIFNTLQLAFNFELKISFLNSVLPSTLNVLWREH